MQQDVITGIGSAIASAIAYGSTYVPVRWFEAGDGLFFQWMMCIGQMLFGVIVLNIAGWPPVFPFAMMSGVFFASGNALTVYIMDGIGMAVGSLLWNTITCVVGWAVTRFGLLGNPQQLPHNNVMNIIGVVIVCIGGFIFGTITHRPIQVRPVPCAILLTAFVGCLYGNMLTPINYLVMHSAETGNPSNISSYFFSFCLGSVLTSTIIFMIYSLTKLNRPFMNPELTLPSLISGIIYAVATYCFFLANQHLDQVGWITRFFHTFP
uniref:Transmembrane protein 144 n=1 Tax=Angiostrongylus cantonensis TaxID=6313 RepID=A0A0K0D5I1_ANGCA